MPLYKYVGNRILTTFQNAVVGTDLTEWHSGYRAYDVATLCRSSRSSENSDGFDFDTEIIIQLHEAGHRIVEIPIPTYYGDEICYVNGMSYAKDVTERRPPLPGPQDGLRHRRDGVRHRRLRRQGGRRHLARPDPGAGWRCGRRRRVLDLGCSDGQLGARLHGAWATRWSASTSRSTRACASGSPTSSRPTSSRASPTSVGGDYDVVLVRRRARARARTPSGCSTTPAAVLRPGGSVDRRASRTSATGTRGPRVALGRFDYDAPGHPRPRPPALLHPAELRGPRRPGGLGGPPRRSRSACPSRWPTAARRPRRRGGVRARRAAAGSTAPAWRCARSCSPTSSSTSWPAPDAGGSPPPRGDPHVPGGGEHRHGAPPGAGRRARRSTCWWSTTAAPTAPPSWPRPPAPRWAGQVLRRPAKAGLGSAYRAGFERGLAAGLRRPGRDGRRPVPRPRRRCPGSWRRSTTAPTWPSARATCPAGSSPHWPLPPARCCRGGATATSGSCWVSGCSDATAGFRAYRADAPGGASTTRPPRPTATPSRWRWPTGRAAPAGRIVELPITFADRVRGTSKMSGRIVVEAMLLVTWWAVRDRVLRRKP